MTLKLRWLHGCLLGASIAWPATAEAHSRRWWCIDNCADIPRQAQPAPPGTYINRWVTAQDTAAEQDDFVLYKHMWYRGGAELGPLGRYQLDLISRRMPTVPFPIVIETSKNDALDEERRNVVVKLLGMRGMEDQTRVVVAFPIAEGLYGDAAPIIYNGLLFGGGTGFGGNGGLGGGFGGGGFGGFSGFGGLPFAGFRGFGGAGNFGF